MKYEVFLELYMLSQCGLDYPHLYQMKKKGEGHLKDLKENHSSNSQRVNKQKNILGVVQSEYYSAYQIINFFVHKIRMRAIAKIRSHR